MKRFNHNRHTTLKNRKLRFALSVRDDGGSLTAASQIGRLTDDSNELNHHSLTDPHSRTKQLTITLNIANRLGCPPSEPIPLDAKPNPKKFARLA